MLVDEAKAVGGIVLEHAAVLAGAVEPSLGAAAAGRIVLDSGDEFVEGKVDFGELREELFGDLAVGLEES
jgi:hypothetical protein